MRREAWSKAWEWGVGVGCEAFVLAGNGCHKRHDAIEP